MALNLAAFIGPKASLAFGLFAGAAAGIGWVAMSLGVIYAFVLGDGGAIRIAILRHERTSLDRNIVELQHNAALLENEIALLDSDPFYIEKTGRERYGYIRPGERVYKIVPTDTKSK